MNTRKNIIAAAIVAGLLSGTAFAAGEAQEEGFKNQDTTGVEAAPYETDSTGSVSTVVRGENNPGQMNKETQNVPDPMTESSDEPASSTADAAETVGEEGFKSKETTNVQQPIGDSDQNNVYALDLDRDGNISREEAEVVPGMSDQWSSLDTNQDGYLDEAEMARFEPEKAE